MNEMPVIVCFDIPICDCALEEAADAVVNAMEEKPRTQFCFVNAHCVNLAFSRPEYKSLLQSNPRNFADGAGMRIAAKWAGTPLADNVNGTDLFPALCRRLNAKSSRVFLLGGEPGIAEKLRDHLNQDYPNMQIAGIHHGYFSDEESEAIADKIRSSGAELLLAAMGVPRQDLWIQRWQERSGAFAAMGVGGLFNFYSGAIPRAPLWMRRAGLEWLHRLHCEPGRLWRRYLIGNAVFLWRMVWWKKNG